MIPQHSSATNEHFTPAHVVERARRVLGGIDLDPASCVEANATVQATHYFTQIDDGLALPWHGRAFLNPPGGKLTHKDGRWVPAPKNARPGSARSSMAVWWETLAREYAAGRVTSAIFVGFTLEILRSSQTSVYPGGVAFPVQFFPRCYPKERLKFTGGSPTHANVIVYLPPPDHGLHVESARFKAAFSDLGWVDT